MYHKTNSSKRTTIDILSNCLNPISKYSYIIDNILYTFRFFLFYNIPSVIILHLILFTLLAVYQQIFFLSIPIISAIYVCLIRHEKLKENDISIILNTPIRNGDFKITSVPKGYWNQLK